MPLSSTTDPVALGAPTQVPAFGSFRIAYLSAQAVEQGQDSWAAVTEIISAWRRAGWDVDTWFVEYEGKAPGALGRLRAMNTIQRRLRQHLSEYDALYVRGHPMAFSASKTAREMGIPVFQECNGTYEDLFIAWPAARIARGLFEGLQRTQFTEANWVFCGTEQQRRWLQAETGHDRIEISPNGANAELFRPDVPRRAGLPERFALFFGQFAPWQGIETLLAAKRSEWWPKGVGLVFAGDGVRRDLVELAASVDPEIVYLGRLPYTELPNVIAHSVVSTSPQFTTERASEGFSALKLYESMSCGVPVIGSDYPGVGDIIRRYDCGLVVEPGSAAELARAVATIADDHALAKLMGERGRYAVEHECSWDARARQRMSTMYRVMRSLTIEAA